MSGPQLANRMRQPSPFLLLDCRSFISYNLNHIRGSLNLSCCDRLTKRRLASGRSVADLLSGPEAKKLFRSLDNADIVIYDDDTVEVQSLPQQHPLYLVFSSLRKTGKDAYVLQGGFAEFHGSYSPMCANPKQPETAMQQLYSPTTPVLQPHIESADVSQILPYLFLGNERDANNPETMNKLGITHVLNVTSHLPQCFEGQMKYKRLPATDSAHQNLKQYFQDAFSFIEETAASEGKLLIHCQAGISRSATLTIAYIMKRTNMSMVEAYRFVKNKREIVAPNFNFMGQLLEFENNLRDGLVERSLEPKLPMEGCA